MNLVLKMKMKKIVVLIIQLQSDQSIFRLVMMTKLEFMNQIKL